ncbi:MAG: DUF1549 domain-containing protein [Planctomycetota bacterium]
MKCIYVILVLCFSALIARAEMPAQKAAAEIDALLEAHWKSQNIKPNALAGDDVFVRRIYLDLVGRIPTTAEAQSFLQNTQPNKRAELIDALLKQESYVSHFYNFWADILRYKSNFTNTANVIPAAYGKYIKESLRSNKPYDTFVYEMLSAKGYAWDNGAVGYYNRDPEMPLDNMAITARVFLGTRIECAQCHNHPFDKWTQTEFYHLAAYTYGNRAINEAFNGARDAIRVRQDAILADFKKEKAASSDNGAAAEKRKNERMEAMEYRKVVGIIKGCVGQLFSPIGTERRADAVLKLPHDFKEPGAKPFDAMKPAPMFGSSAEIALGQDAAEVFAHWATSPKNPRFTQVIVNRLWKKMFGLALTEPLDELRDDTKSMIPDVQSRLEKLMIDQHYDMKAFLAIIANTRAYQAAVTRDEVERGSVYHFQGPVLRRMTAEQIWDSIVTLANHEPDARDIKREERDERRIIVSKMACDAYLNFDGTKLVDMAYAYLQSELELQKREHDVKEALVVAKRTGEKAKEIELRHQEGALDKERGQALVKGFLMPILSNLAQKKCGTNVVPVADPNYKMNANPRVLQVETWRSMYVPGYGPAPKTAVQLEADKEREKRHRFDLAKQASVPEKDYGSFATYVERTHTDWLRASELDSPASRGHVLRTMGQSDRDFVENANSSASIPQALLLMNSDIITDRNLLSPYSPLMLAINNASTPDAKLDAAYFAILSRKPTDAERAIWSKAASANPAKIDDVIYALLNTKQFIFIQ